MNYQKYIKYILLILITAYLIYMLYWPLVNICLPFGASLIIAYLLSPIVDFFEKKKISRVYAILIIYFAIFLLAALITKFLLPVLIMNIGNLIERMPYISEKYNFILDEMIIRYQLSQLPEPLKNMITVNIDNLNYILNNFILESANTVSSFISNIIFIALIPFITFYILKDKEYLKLKLKELIPVALRDDVIVTWYHIDLILKRFIRGQLLISLIVGTLVTIGMYLIGVKYALVLGIIAGLTDVIPYVGPFLGGIPSVLIALTQSPLLALKAILVFVIVQQIESGFISPRIVGKSVGMHPITVIFIILLSEQLFGIIGMFFAVPVYSVLSIIFKKILEIMISDKDKIIE